MGSAKARKNRKRNAPATFGGLDTQSRVGAQPDDADLDGVLVHDATDMELATALCQRGYDVRCRVPTDSAIASRKRKHARWLKAKERREAAEVAAEKAKGIS